MKSLAGVRRSMFGRFALLWIVCLLALCGNSAQAARVLTLSAPSSFQGGKAVPFQVRGDHLGATTLQVWRVVDAAAGEKQVAVWSGTQSPRRGASNITFWVKPLATGLYLAKAKSGAASHTTMLRFTAVFARHWLSVSGNGGVPSRKVAFSVTGSEAKQARLRIWRVEADGSPRQRVVYERSAARKKNEYSIGFAAPLLQPGIYLAQAFSGSLRALTYVRISDIGLVTNRAPRELLVYAVRLSTGQPMPNAAVRVDDAGVQRYDEKRKRNVWVRRPQAPRSQTAGSDGVVRLFNTPPSGTLNVTVVAPDSSRASGEAPLAQSDEDKNDLRVLFYTERPIYRPGQKVFFKGLVRRDLSISGQREGSSPYAVVAGRNVRIQITDAENNTVEELKLKTNAMGSFAGSIELPDEAPVGRYAVETKIAPATKTDIEQISYSRFQVQEYRKPEYEISATPLLELNKPWATQGKDFQVQIEGRYLFGGAVKGAQIEYSNAASGTVKLDENGQAVVTVSNPINLDSDDKNHGSDVTRTLHIKATDNSNRVVETDVAVLCPWSEIKPTLSFDRNIYRLQDQSQIEVETRDPAGRPITATTRVRLYFYVHHTRKDPRTLKVTTWDEERLFTDQIVQTDAAGHGQLNVRLGKAGYIKAVVSAQDSNNRVETATENVWVISREQTRFYGADFSALNVVLGYDEYSPGDTVQALITTNDVGATALVTLRSDRIWMVQTVKLTGNATPFSFKFPREAAPGAHLSIGFVRGANSEDGLNWVSTSTYIKAPDPTRALNIQVVPAKKSFRPGEMATYTVSTKDSKGRPQRAEVSLGFVDKAIYNLANDETPDPTDFFYGARPDRVATSWFLPRELQGGSYQRIEKAVPVRQKFEDTAYWNPFVVTGANGTATLKFAFPDNLTTWRATARGITSDTKVGLSTRETLVTKPLLVRLELPRFLVQHDRVRAQIIVQNNTKSAQNVRVSLRGDTAQIVAVGDERNGAQSGQVAAGQSASFFWTIGTDAVPRDRQLSFTATARADNTSETFDDSTDAMKLSLPIKPHGVRVRSWQAGVVEGARTSESVTLKAPANAIANATRLDINFSPSLAGPMLAALPELQGYPYGCTEQTLSRFVPTVVAVRALRRLGKPLPQSMKNVPKMVRVGLTTLRGYQHADGGWGWWKDDDTDPFLTAYAVYGLSLARDAGFEVDRNLILRGMRSLQDQFGKETRSRAGSSTRSANDNATTITSDTRAWMMLAFATAQATVRPVNGELNADDYAGAVFKVRNELSNYGLASLTLAYARGLAANAPAKTKTVTLRSGALMAYLGRVYRAQMDPITTIYRSTANGRYYYREAKTHRAVFIDVPKTGLVVPRDAAIEDSKLAGYAETNRKEPASKPIFVGDRAALTTLVAQLEASATRQTLANGPGAHWTAREDDKQSGGWMASDVETTSLAIQALVAAKPNSPLLLPAVRWLMNARRGNLWETTKDSAQAVIALADYLSVSNELAPNETVRVLVNGELQKTVRFTSADIGAPDQTIRLEGLSGDAQVTFERDGQGAVYYAAHQTAYTSNDLDVREDNGFSIQRHYAILNSEGHWREVTGAIPSGQSVRVELSIVTKRPREYVLAEDPIPAGFEILPSEDQSAWKVEQLVDPDCDCKTVTLDPPPGWNRFPMTRRDDHDDRIAFFASYLGGSDEHPGQYLIRYILRPETIGSHVALPARIEAMYAPDINGRSAQTQADVQ